MESRFLPAFVCRLPRRMPQELGEPVYSSRPAAISSSRPAGATTKPGSRTRTPTLPTILPSNSVLSMEQEEARARPGLSPLSRAVSGTHGAKCRQLLPIGGGGGLRRIWVDGEQRELRGKLAMREGNAGEIGSC